MVDHLEDDNDPHSLLASSEEMERRTSEWLANNAGKPLHPNYQRDVLPPNIPTSRFDPKEFKACMPSFIVGGAIKAGTTSLYIYLTQHPDILGVEGQYLYPLKVRRQ